jgi:hypothetical protein
MPQPDGNSRPQVAWWWDGSDHGYLWALLVALAGLVVLFSLGVLLTAGDTPIRSVALANLGNGLGVALLPTLVALRRLDRRRRFGEFGVPADQDVRRALRPTLVMLGLVDERPPAARPARPLPPVRRASWYRLLAACWAGFVLLDAIAVWATAAGLFAVPDPDELAVGVAVVALPVLLAWLVVGLVALRKAARVAHWLARLERGRRAAPRQPLRRRLAAGGRRAVGATVAGWRGLRRGAASGARWTAGATLAGWHELQRGLASGGRWTAGATLAGWRELQRGVAAAARWTARATEPGRRELERGIALAARWAAGMAAAGWRELRSALAAEARLAADGLLAGWRELGSGLAGWRELRGALAAEGRLAADGILTGWRELRSGLARWRELRSGLAARAGGGPVQPLGRRLADDGRRAAGVTLARWRDVESGSRR